MATVTTKCLLSLLLLACVKAYDYIDLEANYGAMAKLLRAMENQTKADTLNLPANSTSIRENITDTFSCENRTYGYYADVDNECQVFHVCLPSKTPSGRNTTYRWSFICPEETIFNQEVLVCSRPRDSIDCEDAPMFYDVNLEFGKVTNETEDNMANTEPTNVENANPAPAASETASNAEPQGMGGVRIKNKRRPIKKQNIIVENLLRTVVNDEIKKGNLQVMDFEEKNLDFDMGPVIADVSETQVDQEMKESEEIENARMASERSVKRKGRNNRGSFRFKAVSWL